MKAISVAAHLAVPAFRPHQGIQLGMEALWWLRAKTRYPHTLLSCSGGSFVKEVVVDIFVGFCKLSNERWCGFIARIFLQANNDVAPCEKPKNSNYI